ncbi:stalk domain-containing protein [Paenibacillus hubeiensis]|uniref:stalk domain-containing protein n=1 Tax=Paenibacillus hubeiensis TaxID=3077330 RepID=UPI0031BAFFB7
MKKSLFKTVVTLGIGMMIGSATLAAAAPSTVNAILTKFSFAVDGKEQNLQSDTLVYNGKTYLPIREVAQMTGYKLIYDKEQKKIEFETIGESFLNNNSSTPPSTTSQPQTKIYNVGDVVKTPYFDIKVTGVRYDSSFNDSPAGEGATYAIVEFDVLVKKEPTPFPKWASINFIDIYTLDTGVEYMGGTIASGNITVNEWSSVSVGKLVKPGVKVSDVKISDPILQGGNY